MGKGEKFAPYNPSPTKQKGDTTQLQNIEDPPDTNGEDKRPNTPEKWDEEKGANRDDEKWTEVGDHSPRNPPAEWAEVATPELLKEWEKLDASQSRWLTKIMRNIHPSRARWQNLLTAPARVTEWLESGATLKAAREKVAAEVVGTQGPQQIHRTNHSSPLHQPKPRESRSLADLIAPRKDLRPERPRYSLPEAGWQKVFDLLRSPEALGDAFKGFSGDLAANGVLRGTTPFTGGTKEELLEFQKVHHTLMAFPTPFGGGKGEKTYAEILDTFTATIKGMQDDDYFVLFTMGHQGTDWLSCAQYSTFENVIEYNEILKGLQTKAQGYWEASYVTSHCEDILANGRRITAALGIHVFRPPAKPQSAATTHEENQPRKRIIRFLATVGPKANKYEITNPERGEHPKGWYLLKGKGKGLGIAQDTLNAAGANTSRYTAANGDWEMVAQIAEMPPRTVQVAKESQIQIIAMADYELKEGETIITAQKADHDVTDLYNMGALANARFYFQLGPRKAGMVVKSEDIAAVVEVASKTGVTFFGLNGRIQQQMEYQRRGFKASEPVKTPDIATGIIPWYRTVEEVTKLLKGGESEVDQWKVSAAGVRGYTLTSSWTNRPEKERLEDWRTALLEVGIRLHWESMEVEVDLLSQYQGKAIGTGSGVTGAAWGNQSRMEC